MEVDRERISVVLGFDYVKGAHEDGSTVIFPSVAAQRSSTANGLSHGQEQYRVKVGELHYDVGEAGMAAGGSRIWTEKEGELSYLSLVIGTAIHILSKKNKPVDLVVGISRALYNLRKDVIKKMLVDLAVEITIDGITKTIRFNHVLVIPTIVGVYYYAIHNIDGSVKDSNLINRQVAVINPEYEALELLFMSRGRKGLFPREELSGSENPGMNEVFKSLQSKTDNLINAVADPMEIEKAISWYDGEFDHSGKTYDLKEIHLTTFKDHAQKIVDSVKQKWGAEINNLHAILIGEDNAISALCKESFPAVREFDAPEFSSAFGSLAVQSLALKTSAHTETSVNKE